MRGVLLLTPLVGLGYHAGAVTTANPAAPLPKYSIHVLGYTDAAHRDREGNLHSIIDTQPGKGLSGAGATGLTSYWNGDYQHDSWLLTGNDGRFRQIGVLDTTFQGQPVTGTRARSQWINDRGQVVGDTIVAGYESRLAWFYDPLSDQTTRIGYSTLDSSRTDIGDMPLVLQPNGFTVGRSAPRSDGYLSGWVWSFDPSEGVTRRIGLPDAIDLGLGIEVGNPSIKLVTADNVVIGETSRPSSQSAVWVHRPGDLVSERIGLYGGQYVRKDGAQFATFGATNGNGLIAGWSHFTTSFGGIAATWVYDPITHGSTKVGLGSPGDETTQDNDILLTHSNHLFGTSSKYITSSISSQLNWVYDHSIGATKRLGLLDPPHVLSQGSTHSVIRDYSESGFALGDSQRRDAHQTSSWHYSPITGHMTQVGLKDSVSGAYIGSQGTAVNEAGQAIGFSFTSVYRSPRPWFYDPTTQQTIELASNLAQMHGVPALEINADRRAKLNENGQVAGVLMTENAGDYAWFYDHRTGETHTDFDYRDAYTHGRVPSQTFIDIHGLTDSGLVLGSSERTSIYKMSGGQTPWLYDSNTRETHSLIFSEDSAGHAMTKIAYWTEQGEVIGEYDHYTDSDVRSKRYFYWSIEQGFHDLEELIVGDLVSLGWADLAAITETVPPDVFPHQVLLPQKITTIDSAVLFGYAIRSEGYEFPFLLVRVPEPTSWTIALLLSAVVVVGWRRSTREMQTTFPI